MKENSLWQWVNSAFQSHKSSLRTPRNINIFIIIISAYFLQSCTSTNPHHVNPDTYTEPLYNMDLLGVYSLDSTDNDRVTALFAVTPKEMVHFRPVLSMKIGYSINDGEFKEDSRINPAHNCNLIIIGKNIKESYTILYDAIKDKIDLSAHEDLMFLAVNFWDLGEKVNSMKIKYGLWEKNNIQLRIEQDYTAEVEELY